MIYKICKRYVIQRAIRNGLQLGHGVVFVDIPKFGTEPYLIKIGDKTKVSSDVTFLTHDGGTWVFRRAEEFRDVIKYGVIEVGKNCFLGAKSIIMPNVTIGDSCVVAAGAVVTKSFPSGSIIGGCPARSLGSIEEYSRKAKLNCPQYDRVAYARNKRAELTRVFWNR